jgi:hypothetical protein
LGILLKGRQLKVLKALDKKAAHDKELERATNEVHDHRNLYLAKVGSTNFLFPSLSKSFSLCWVCTSTVA